LIYETKQLVLLVTRAGAGCRHPLGRAPGHSLHLPGAGSGAARPGPERLHDFKFTLYDATSGASSWAGVDQRPVIVTNGHFTVLLDFGAVFTGDARWLEVAVRDQRQRAPYGTPSARQTADPTPYALHAASAATATTANSAGAVPWAGVDGVPGGFADAVDNDTTYSAGLGLG